MEKALTITISGKTEISEFAISDSYELLKTTVGGWIECVHLPSIGADMWVNEEGKLDGLTVNVQASKLWIKEYGNTDVIVGDVIITGGVDEDGDTLGLSEEQIARILELL